MAAQVVLGEDDVEVVEEQDAEVASGGGDGEGDHRAEGRSPATGAELVAEGVEPDQVGEGDTREDRHRRPDDAGSWGDQDRQRRSANQHSHRTGWREGRGGPAY